MVCVVARAGDGVSPLIGLGARRGDVRAGARGDVGLVIFRTWAAACGSGDVSMGGGEAALGGLAVAGRQDCDSKRSQAPWPGSRAYAAAS